MLFFGARAAEELPYFGPLHEAAEATSSTSTSRSPASPESRRSYVQDLIRRRGDDVARLLRDEHCYIYVCGLKGMEEGVAEAFAEVCRQHEMDWAALLPDLRAKGRYHLETY